MDPEQSMMMISALPPDGAAAGAAPVSSAVTVTIALTSRPPDGRKGFWSISTVKPGRPVVIAALFSYPGPGPDTVGHVHQLDPPLGDQGGERAVAALKSEAQRPLVRLAAEDPVGRGAGRPALGGRRRGRHPVERGPQDLHGELVPPRVVFFEGKPPEPDV